LASSMLQKLSQTFPSFQLPESLKTVVENVRAVSAFLEQQIKIDKQSGSGVISSALGLGKEVEGYYQLFQNLKASSLEDLGKKGQLAILNNLKTSAKKEALDFLKEQGLDLGLQNYGLEKFGLQEVGEKALGSLLGKQAGADALGQSISSTSTGAIGAKAMGAIGAAYAGYKLFDNLGKRDVASGAINGATVGAYIGTHILPGVGTVIGGAIGAVAGGLMGLFKFGKHADQVKRDQMRSQLQGVGFIDSQYQVTLADGSKYDIGKDGRFKLPNLDGSDRRAYEIDFNNPLAGDTVASLDPLGYLLFPDNEKLRTDFVGYLTNAALSNATTPEQAMLNIHGFYQQLQITPEVIASNTEKLLSTGKITNEQAQVAMVSFLRVQNL